MKKFVVPVSWTVSAFVVVEAEDADEAADEAEAGNLPKDAEYVCDSFEAHFDDIEELLPSLTYGDEIYWNDPDGGASSGPALFSRYQDEDIAYIEKDGVEVQVYIDELS